MVEALVHAVKITAHWEKAAARFTERLRPADVEHVLSSSFMLIGIHQEIAEQLHRQGRH